MKNLSLYKNFSTPKKRNKAVTFLSGILQYFTVKQKIFLFLIFTFGIVSYANAQIVEMITTLMPIKTISDLTSNNVKAETFRESFMFLDVFKYFIQLITNSQIESINFIGITPMGGTGVFNKITNGLTIFAAIACFIKLLNHYLNTERFDNVKAFTGFFSYVSIFILFLFSNTIVKHVSGLNSNINTSNIANISNNIMKQVDDQAMADWKKLNAELEKMTEEQKDSIDPIRRVWLEMKMNWYQFSFIASKKLFYLYMTLFGSILMSSLAIPSVVMSIMVKVTLSIMILGSKLVFLLAFIPGFENVWKTYMMNLLNVLLWIPIFNLLISFIIAFVSTIIDQDSISTGQIIWLSIITMIFAYQSISLTTTTANMIINGSGSGIAGAMGSLSAMSAASMVATTAGTTASVGVMAATGGKSAISGAAAGKFSK